MKEMAGKKLFGVVDKGKEKYVVAALLLLALTVRLYYLHPGLWHTDSVIAARRAEGSIRDGRLYYLQGVLGYPGYAAFNVLVYGGWHLLTGSQSAENILLYSNAVVGALGAVMIYYLTKELTGSGEAGAYAGAILAFLPEHISLSTFPKDLTLGSAAIMLAVWLALKARENQELKWKIGAGAMLGYAAAVRQQEFLFIPALLLFYYSDRLPVAVKKKKDAVRIKFSDSPWSIVEDVIALVVPVFIVFALFYVPRMIHQPGWSLIDAFLFAGGEQSGFSLFSDNLLNYSIPWVTKTISLLGWLILAGGLLVNYRRRKGVWFALVFWMVSYFMVFGNFQGVSPYFFFHAFPPAVIMMGWGLEYAFKRWGHITHSAVAALVILMLLNTHSVFEYRSRRCGPCEFAEKIGEEVPENSAVIGMDETQHYEYYGGIRKPMGHPNPMDQQAMQEHFRLIHEYLRNGTNVYVTTAGLSYDFLPQNILAYDQEQQVLFNRATGKAYENLVLNPDRRIVVDRDSHEALPLSGLYALELFNEFKTTKEFTMENEDWHHKDLDSGVYQATLYRLKER